MSQPTSADKSSYEAVGISMLRLIHDSALQSCAIRLLTTLHIDGHAEGCLASALQSSPMGVSIYRRMGYRHVLEYPTWVIQSGAVGVAHVPATA